jgi:cell division septation protein DedD
LSKPRLARPNLRQGIGQFRAKSADKASVNSTPKSADKASDNAAPKSADNASANSAPNAAAGSEMSSASAEPSSTPHAAADTNAASVEGFVVQLAAFTDDKGANALANRLKRTGYPAYTEPVETDRGTLWRVRVGGYPSRAAAGAARAKLKAEGHNGIVAAAK